MNFYPINFKLNTSKKNPEEQLNLKLRIKELCHQISSINESLIVIKCQVDDSVSLEILSSTLKHLRNLIIDNLPEEKNFILIPIGGRCAIQDLFFEVIKIRDIDIIKDIFDRINFLKTEWSQGYIDDKTFAKELQDIEFEFKKGITK